MKHIDLKVIPRHHPKHEVEILRGPKQPADEWKVIVLSKSKGEILVLVESGVEEEGDLPWCWSQPLLMKEDNESVRNHIYY